MAMEHIRDVLARIPAILNGMYESPAEECLGERLRAAVDETASFQTQVWIDTTIGRFRVDILLTDKYGRRIAIEVDGKEFHEPVRDHWRTVFIVGERQVDVVYRVPASDLKINLVGVLAGLATLEPRCFKQMEISRWKEVIGGTYATATDADSHVDEEHAYHSFWARSTASIANHFRSDARECQLAAIKNYYDFAVATGLKDLEIIQEAWELEHPMTSMNHAYLGPFEIFGSCES